MMLRVSNGLLRWAWEVRGEFWWWSIPIEKKQCGSFPPGKPMSRNGGAMKASSDKMYDKFKDNDFSDAKPVAETPHLAKLQEEAGGKSRITMRVDNDVLAIFKARAEMVGGNYQTMMNEALKQFAQELKLADVVREAIHETLESCLTTPTTGRARKLG